MQVLIPSYFGPRDQPEVRKKRKEFHQRQLEWLFEQGFAPADIWISYKDYDDSDFTDGVQYVKRPDEQVLIPPALGRNQLLSEWYKTNNDWCLVLDNDAILDDRNKGNIIEWLRHNELSEVDAFVPVNPGAPGKGAFNRLWEDSNIDDNWVFQRGELKGSFMFLKNLKKHHGHELYFDTGNRCKSAEDYFFGFDMACVNMVPMWCNNIVLKELATSKSVSMLWKQDTDSRQDYQVAWKEAAVGEYAEMEIKNDQLRKSRFYDVYGVPKYLAIPKDPTNITSVEDFF